MKFACMSTDITKNKPGAKPTYKSGHKVICRSVPLDLIPLLDQWLFEQKSKMLIEGQSVKVQPNKNSSDK